MLFVCLVLYVCPDWLHGVLVVLYYYFVLREPHCNSLENAEVQSNFGGNAVHNVLPFSSRSRKCIGLNSYGGLFVVTGTDEKK